MMSSVELSGYPIYLNSILTIFLPLIPALKDEALRLRYLDKYVQGWFR